MLSKRNRMTKFLDISRARASMLPEVFFPVVSMRPHVSYYGNQASLAQKVCVTCPKSPGSWQHIVSDFYHDCH